MSLSVTICSQCSSMAHFSCIDHCTDVFCGKCSVKHRTDIRNQMNQLAEEIRRCKIEPVTSHDEIDQNFQRASQQTLQRTHDSIKNMIAELQLREQIIRKEIDGRVEMRRKERETRTNAALLTSEEAIEFTHLLEACLKRDQLLDSETLVNIQQRLNARIALGQSASEVRPPILDLGKFEVEKILSLRFAPRAASAPMKDRNNRAIAVTVRLGKQKFFQNPLENTFSIGKHPTAISLNDCYVETFFCRRTPSNSLILLSTTSIDIVNRGSGLESSIRLSKILGTIKDKILAGAWCEYSQRLILVGNHRMYVYDLQSDDHAIRFRCEPVHGDPKTTARFINCNHLGTIFYAYKSGENVYTIETHARPPLPTKGSSNEPEENQVHFLPSDRISCKIHGHIAGMCVAHNRLAVVYRKFAVKTMHFLSFFDHNLKQQHTEEILLPEDIRWITAIYPFSGSDQYLLCDPRGQQLILYKHPNGISNRRFRIGAINACCLTDGRLVVWLQKQYPSSPTGKLHFITAPHLEGTSSIAKSRALLTA